MKLPGIRYGPVQGLGRFDTSGPMRAANAAAQAARANAQAAGVEAEAARSAGRAIATVQGMAMSLYEANAAAEYDHALAEYQKHEKMLRTMLTSSPVIDTTRWALPDWVAVPGGKTERVVDETGKTQDIPRRYVPTHEVASQIYNGSMERVMSAVQSEVRNPLAAAQLRKRLPGMQAEGAAQVAAKQHAFFVDHQKGMVSAAIEEFTQAGDERSAMMALQRAHHTGLIDRDEFVKRHAEIGSRIDQRTYDQLLMAASESPEEVEQVQDFISQGLVLRADPQTGETVWAQDRISPDDRWKLRQRTNALLKEAEQAKVRQHKENAQAAGEMLLRGQLSSIQLADWLADDKLSLTQALTLDNARRARQEAGGSSSPGGLDYFMKEVSSARWVQDGERMSAKLKRVETDLQAALLGVYPNGREYHGPRLSPADHQKALAAVRREESAFTQQPEYKNALQFIRSYTGTSGLQLTDGPSAGDMAFIQFKQALDSYMNRTGANADPMKFVRDHAGNFTMDSYAGQSLDQFVEKYPDQFDWLEEAAAEAGNDPKRLAEVQQRVMGGIVQRYFIGTLTAEEADIMALQASGEPLAAEIIDQGEWLLEQQSREDAEYPDPAGEVLP